jgi:fatty acyl-CoA reductase
LYFSFFRLVTLHHRITDSAWRLYHFTTREWDVQIDNVYGLLNTLNPQDRVTFNFGMKDKDIDWHDYMYKYCIGVRRYVMKEDDSTVPAAKARLFR